MGQCVRGMVVSSVTLSVPLFKIFLNKSMLTISIVVWFNSGMVFYITLHACKHRANHRQRNSTLSMTNTNARARVQGMELALTKPSDKRGKILSHARITSERCTRLQAFIPKCHFARIVSRHVRSPRFKFEAKNRFVRGEIQANATYPCCKLRACAFLFFSETCKRIIVRWLRLVLRIASHLR